MTRSLLICGMSIGLSLLMGHGSLAAQVSELQLKALYVFNFAKYTEWPDSTFASASAPFVIGVLGDDPVNSSLTQLAGSSVRGRSVLVKHFESAEKAKGSQLVYISSSERGDLPQILATLRATGVLTVSDMENFTNLGGIIGLNRQETKLRFTVNISAAQQSNLKLSSQLLKLASSIE